MSVSAIPVVWLVQSPAQRESPSKSWSYSVSASATDEMKTLNHSENRASDREREKVSTVIYLHDFDEFEQQFLSVLSFLLLDDYRAHPSGQDKLQSEYGNSSGHEGVVYRVIVWRHSSITRFKTIYIQVWSTQQLIAAHLYRKTNTWTICRFSIQSFCITFKG